MRLYVNPHPRPAAVAVNLAQTVRGAIVSHARNLCNQSLCLGQGEIMLQTRAKFARVIARSGVCEEAISPEVANQRDCFAPSGENHAGLRSH
jgi:hypothetical protein